MIIFSRSSRSAKLLSTGYLYEIEDRQHRGLFVPAEPQAAPRRPPRRRHLRGSGQGPGATSEGEEGHAEGQASGTQVVGSVVSEQIRRDVWVALLDATHQSRYYGRLFERYSRRQHVADVTLWVSGSLGLILLAARLYPWLPVLCVVVASLASLIGTICQYSRKSSCLYFIRSDCQSLEQRWELLWSRVQSDMVEDDEALERNQELLDALRNVTDKASLVGLPVDDKVNQSSWEEAIAVKEGQYAENRPDQGILAAT